MTVRNADIAAVFEDIADILEVEGANPYRIRAYRNAARTIGAYGHDIAALLAGGGTLPKLPGIGEDLAAKIGEIAASGTCALRERLRREVPATLVALMQVAGIGPRRAQLLYHDLGIETAAQLLEAARNGLLRRVHGFGEKTERKLAQALRATLEPGQRTPTALAAIAVEDLLATLRASSGVRSVTVCGSLRRMRETVGDIDLLAVCERPAAVMRGLTGHVSVREVIAQGPARATVVLHSGLQVDLRAVAPESAGAALVYLTGSKTHNIAIRRIAQQNGLKINEYGVFRGTRRVAGDTEASVYRAIGLPLIPPELRENRGEIQLAAQGRLPELVKRGDLRGDLHVHTLSSDGTAGLAAMAEAARAAGLEYLAITDHSQHLHVAHGLDEKRLLHQIDEIEALNAQLQGITLLKGIEVDILEDGSLDLPDRLLARLDIVVGAVHDHFGLPRRKQTQRLQRALAHPHLHVLAHPGCRLLGERDPIDVDMATVIAAAAKYGRWLELNAQPLRMDLTDRDCEQARAQGVMISIASDAHGPSDFRWLDYGIGQARRASLAASDVANTRSLAALRRLLA